MLVINVVTYQFNLVVLEYETIIMTDKGVMTV